MGKLYELHFDLLPHPPYSPDLPPSDFYLFADIKECSRQRDLAPMKKWLPKLKRSLRLKINCSTKKALKSSKSVGMEISLLKETIFDEWSRILHKSCGFISHLTNLLGDVIRITNHSFLEEENLKKTMMKNCRALWDTFLQSVPWLRVFILKRKEKWRVR